MDHVRRGGAQLEVQAVQKLLLTRGESVFHLLPTPKFHCWPDLADELRSRRLPRLRAEESEESGGRAGGGAGGRGLPGPLEDEEAEAVLR